MTIEHEYPSAYGPGTHWAIDEAGRILDMLKPGTISNEHRAFLAGAIAGALTKNCSETSSGRDDPSSG